VTLILLYLLVLIVVAALLFVIASAVFGRGESLPPLPHSTTLTTLPATGVTGADVDAVKFGQAFRGYKTSEVDWVLARLGSEIDQLRGRLSDSAERLAESHDLVDERSREEHSIDERSREEHRPVSAGEDG
jgi:DivIVA domain-containing protein